MQIDLTSDSEAWVNGKLAAGQFANAQDAVRHAINQAKLAELRAELAAAVSDPRRYSLDDVKAAVTA